MIASLDGKWALISVVWHSGACTTNILQCVIFKFLLLEGQLRQNVAHVMPPLPLPPFVVSFRRISMSIGFRMNTSTVGPDDSISLDVVARNNSSSKVNQMLIQLKQETKWNAHRHHDNRTRTIASILVPASELGELQWAAGPGTERGQSVAVVESNARQDLEQQLSAGRSTRVELKVPGNALLTTQAPNISVSHTVGVVLDTPCCIGAPAVWTPLYLQVGAGGTEVQPGGGSVVLAQAAPCPSPQTIPYPAGPTQPSPYLAPQTPQYFTGPYGSVQYSTGPYGSAQIIPYPTPQGATYGAPPGASLGYTPGVQCYPTHQAVAAVKMDENGRVIPRVVPHRGG